MKFTKSYLIVLPLIFFVLTAESCNDESAQESKDREIVSKQQTHYGVVQPLPFYDYSIPRDIVTQIYNVVTQESRNTYTVIQSITGQTMFHGPSMGYGIPADVSLTNPLQPSSEYNHGMIALEQAEPNGLFSSKNTDGTWVLFVDKNGDVTPVYTENKVTTFPFFVKQAADGVWHRAGDKKATMTIKMK